MAKLNYVRGLPQVKDAFRDLPPAAQQRIVNALNLSAEEIQEEAEHLAPYDPTTRINLNEQIEVRFARRDQGIRGGVSRQVVAYVIAGDSRERAQAAFRAEYGRAPGPNGHPGHGPQEFMFPAYFRIRKRVRSRIKRAVTQAAKAVANVGRS